MRCQPTKPEATVQCMQCDREYHQICVGYVKPIWDTEHGYGYYCDNCMDEHGLQVSQEINAKG